MNFIGHENQTQLLSTLLSRETVPHALLFSGPASIGKQRVARWFAKEFLSKDSVEPHLETQVAQGTYADLKLVYKEEGSRDISVENIRTLIQDLSLKPYYAAGKVAIINDAHRMSTASSNALLKTLEEPSSDTVLILVTHAPHTLLPTILSRCQAVHFAELSESDTEQVLTSLAEEIDFTAKGIKDLLSLCHGSLEELHLGSFIDPLTLKPTDAKKCREHLSSLHDSLAGIRKSIRGFLEGSPSLGGAMALSELIGKSKETMWLGLSCLRYEVRRQLKSPDPKKTEKAAEMLSALLESERLIAERNANPTLQLSSVLAKHVA